MMTDENYNKILSYFDKQFMDRKTNETGWNYYGLILDWYFDNSILSIDYLSVEDYFNDNGGISFVEDKNLEDQFGSVPESKRFLLLQNILNILKHSKVNKEQSAYIILLISNVLKRYNVKVINPEGGPITVLPDDILDSGSYCNIIRVKGGILRKELKSIYKSDRKLKKRLKYEYENMQKLSACPQILNVYDFNSENNSYLMEQGDKNLYGEMCGSPFRRET